MYGRIFGFQRLARCPKWTPASISSFTCTIATQYPLPRTNGVSLDGVETLHAPRGGGVPQKNGVKKVIVAAAGYRVKGFWRENNGPLTSPSRERLHRLQV